MKNLIPLLLIIYFTGCSSHEPTYPESTEMYEFALPVYIDDDETEIYLNGYFKNPQNIDSITNNTYKIILSTDKSPVKIEHTETTKAVEELKVWVRSHAYSIIVLLNRKSEFTFRFDPKDNPCNKVQVVGSFNSWKPGEDFTREGKLWKQSVKLLPGKYHYQLVIDGEWVLDPANNEKESNNIGGFNSILTINDPNVNAPKLLTKNYTDNQININFTGNINTIVALWNNFSIPVKVDKKNIQIIIPKDAQHVDRSFIRVWAGNKSGYSNDILVPLHKGKVISDVSDLTRNDKHTQVLYFMLVDRFNNGNPAIDAPVIDNEIADKANYHGGDIEGISQKVNDGYFSDLGISMIWLSPITQNPLQGFVEHPKPHRKYSGYHGYWPVTLTTIDQRFGNPDDLRELVDATHKKGMNIILDYVSNHVHEQNKIYQMHPDWATTLDLPDGSKNIRLWDEHRLTTWFDTFLPSLNFEIAEVEELMSDSAKYWIDEFHVDGFRHDATKHIPTAYWRTLTKKLRENTNKEFIFQIGETFGSRQLIRDYVGTDLLDGQFDFNLYFDMRSAFAQESESLSILSNSLKESLKYYGHHSLMGNITGNHDLPRFIAFAGGALQFDEDDKEAGWNRDIEIIDTLGYYRLMQVTAFINSIPGIPVIYYGDEIGMPGAGDPDNRRPMKFDNLSKFEKLVKENTSKIIKLRRNKLELIYGDIIILHSDDESLVYARKYFDKVSIIGFNKSRELKKFNLDMSKLTDSTEWKANFNNYFELKEDNHLFMTLDSYSFEILNNDPSGS